MSSRYETCSKNWPVSYHPWMDSINQLFKEKKIELGIKQSILHEMYHADVTVLEVYYIARAMTVTSAVVTINWHDVYGKESVIFTNNEAIRHFYKVVPYIRTIMELKQKKQH